MRSGRKSKNTTYKVEGAGKTALDLNKLVLAMGWVAAESKNVLEAVGLDGLEGVVDLLDGHVGAGEMHHALHADDVLHFVGDVQSQIGGGATGAPRDVAEGRIVSHHPIHPLQQVVHSILRLRREELEREHHLLLIHQCLLDFVDHLHFSDSTLGEKKYITMYLDLLLILRVTDTTPLNMNICNY